MTTTTQRGKAAALKALRARRKRNKNRPSHDNSRDYAGSPMYFPCETCGDDIEHPETYLTRIKRCRECQALKDAGWLA